VLISSHIEKKKHHAAAHLMLTLFITCHLKDKKQSLAHRKKGTYINSLPLEIQKWLLSLKK